jgi:hypothetical protein
MRTSYPQSEGTDVAIATHLAVCALVCGLLGFGFYTLMQPEQRPNPGLAAYKPPPGTIIIYPPAAQFTYERQAVPALSTDQPSRDIPDETTGRAIQTVEPATTVAPMPATQVKRAPATKAVRVRAPLTKPQHPSGTYAATYPGYAAVH